MIYCCVMTVVHYQLLQCASLYFLFIRSLLLNAEASNWSICKSSVIVMKLHMVARIFFLLPSIGGSYYFFTVNVRIQPLKCSIL